MTDLYNEVLNSETIPLTDKQLDELKCNYAEMVVDDMDLKTLMIMAYDVIVENLKYYSEEDMKEEIVELYDEEILEELMPWVILSHFSETAMLRMTQSTCGSPKRIFVKV